MNAEIDDSPIAICISNKHLKRELTVGKEYRCEVCNSDLSMIHIVTDYGQPMFVSSDRFKFKVNSSAYSIARISLR